jgi:hypothetical protein
MPDGEVGGEEEAGDGGVPNIATFNMFLRIDRSFTPE